jgi:hypothetical protein
MRFGWSRGPSRWCGTLLRALHVAALALAFGPSGGVGADDALWNAQECNCLGLAWFDRDFLTIFQLECTLR